MLTESSPLLNIGNKAFDEAITKKRENREAYAKSKNKNTFESV